MTTPTYASAVGVANADADHFARDHLPPPALWPELRFDLPELDYPARLNCAAALLDHAAGARPALRI